MTTAQYRRLLRRIIKEWRKRLMLEHVVIEIEWSEEPEDEDALASVSCSETYDHALLRFRHDLKDDYDADELNRIVVHELLHVMFRDYAQAVRSVSVTGALSTDVRMLWYDRCRDAEEGVIDRLANRFVELGGVVQ